MLSFKVNPVKQFLGMVSVFWDKVLLLSESSRFKIMMLLILLLVYWLLHDGRSSELNSLHLLFRGQISKKS